jgi:hypothetical protein
MKLVLSLPNFEQATAIWTNEQLKDSYLSELKKKYDLILLTGKDATPDKWWQYNSEDVIYAGVGHGAWYVYTGQNYVTLLDINSVKDFKAFGFIPVSCNVWQNGSDESLCGRLANKGIPFVIGEMIEYALTDTGVAYYVTAENEIYLNLLDAQTTQDLEKIKDNAYMKQIQLAISRGDYVNASILKDDMDNRKVCVNKPAPPPQPPQPEDSYLTLRFADGDDGSPLYYVKVIRKDNNEEHNTANYNWTVFRVPFGKEYSFHATKDGYQDIDFNVLADEEKKDVLIRMKKVTPPAPPQPPVPPSPPEPPSANWLISDPLIIDKSPFVIDLRDIHWELQNGEWVPVAEIKVYLWIKKFRITLFKFSMKLKEVQR